MTRQSLSRVIRGTALTVASLVVTPCFAQDGEWQWSLTPYVWASAINGDVTVGSRSADFDVGFDDTLNNLDMAFLGHLEGKRGKWSVAFSPIYLAVSTDARRTGPLGGSRKADLDLTTSLTELFAAYAVAESWEVMGGVRYVRSDVKLKFTGPVMTGKSTSTEDFTDPIVGVRYHRQINDNWSFRGRGDIGGFDVGSNFSSNVSLLFDYQPEPGSGSWVVGYRVLHMDFDKGNTDMSLLMSGPIAGYTFRF